MLRVLMCCVCVMCSVAVSGVLAQSPVEGLVERIEKGASKKFLFEISDAESPEDFFTLSTKRGKILIEGNNWISVAVGLNWYLKYYAGVQVTRENPTPQLNYLPKVEKEVRYSTELLLRYYLDAPSASHSSAYWNEKRWQQEIDYMALHGINMPLITTGLSEVWRATLQKAGYSIEDIQRFLPHPAYEGWWLEGKIEGWGGPVSSDFTASRAKVGAYAVSECREWGMEPVLMGYNGLLPSDTTQQRAYWKGISRPMVLNPTSESYRKIAELYYKELTRVYGEANYYLVNPLEDAITLQKPQTREEGEAIYASIQNAVQGASWVVGAWEDSPTDELIDYIPRGGVVVLDKWCDALPQWGDKSSRLARRNGFLGHSWIYSAKIDFEGRGSMYGNISRIVGGYYLACESGASFSMVGVGTTNDGVRGNDILFELLFELPWREDQITTSEWVDGYAEARYGVSSAKLKEAWRKLSSTLYSPGYSSERRGATQSVFAARPALVVPRVTSDGTTKVFYDTEELKDALRLMVNASGEVNNRANFESDVVEVALAVLSNYGYEILAKITDAFNSADREELKTLTNNFLYAMLLADNLLNSQPQSMVGNYIEEAMSVGRNPWQRDWLRYGARTMISSWGSEVVANDEEMHDSAFRMYSGVMADLYAKRWARFFNYIEENEVLPIGETYYDIERDWAADKTAYETKASSDAVMLAREILDFVQ